ncbi:MAG: hypothetical protein J6U06_01930, partial [Spirochaetaceae bacterium]|nr:hypothetical protein [Spirochaetaceae bacterium]
GGGGTSGGGSGTAANAKDTFTGSFTIDGKSYNTLVMDGNENSGTAIFSGPGGVFTANYQKQASNAAYADNARVVVHTFEGTYILTSDGNNHITVTFTNDYIDANGDTIPASGRGSRDDGVIVLPYVTVSAQNEGIQFIVTKPKTEAFKNGFQNIIIWRNDTAGGGTHASLDIWNNNYNNDSYTFIYPLVEKDKKYTFTVQLEPRTPQLTNNRDNENYERLEITAKGGVGDVLPLGFNKNAVCTASYSEGRPHVSISNHQVPSASNITAVQTNVVFFAGNKDWVANNATIFFLGYTANGLEINDINPPLDWINDFNRLYKQTGKDKFFAQYSFTFHLNNIISGCTGAKWDTTMVESDFVELDPSTLP